MSWKKTADVVAVVGSYEAQGVKKNKYMNCGIVLTNEKGQQSIKLSCIPFKEEGGIANFLSIYPIKEKDGGGSQPKREERDDDFPTF